MQKFYKIEDLSFIRVEDSFWFFPMNYKNDGRCKVVDVSGNLFSKRRFMKFESIEFISKILKLEHCSFDQKYWESLL